METSFAISKKLRIAKQCDKNSEFYANGNPKDTSQPP